MTERPDNYGDEESNQLRGAGADRKPREGLWRRGQSLPPCLPIIWGFRVEWGVARIEGVWRGQEGVFGKMH